MSQVRPLPVTDELLEKICHHSPLPWTAGQVQQVVQLYNGGKSLRDVGEVVGCSMTAVARILRLAGHTVRPSNKAIRQKKMATQSPKENRS